MENSEALSKIKNELEKISGLLNDPENNFSEEVLQLTIDQVTVAGRMLSLSRKAIEKEEVQEQVVAEETIPVDVKEVIGLSLENTVPEEKEEVEVPPVTEKKNVKASEEKPDNTLAGKMKRKPIADLKTAIGINEKFAFISLFGSNSNTWNEALQKLNSLSSFEEAEGLIAEFSTQFNWKEDDETLQTLMELLQRRYL